MTPLNLASRPLLGLFFVSAGIDSLRDPDPRAQVAKPLLDKARAQVSVLPDDDVLLVRINAGVQVAAGAMLTLGKLPRLSALALAASLLPTTLAGHSFWEHEDPGERASHQIHLGKNVAILGGLLAVVSDASHQARAHAWHERARKARTKQQGKQCGTPHCKSGCPVHRGPHGAHGPRAAHGPIGSHIPGSSRITRNSSGSSSSGSSGGSGGSRAPKLLARAGGRGK
ncbi:DoxX family membrane protein [Streptomyces axinellae]|uniref:DoxX family protein n=1 Tax=Streptomyces axinellae TaxID=552788 RepID=A0ABN3QSP0_9ACTN